MERLRSYPCPWGPQQHEEVAILANILAKMSGFRMLLGLRECEAWSNPWYHHLHKMIQGTT